MIPPNLLKELIGMPHRDYLTTINMVRALINRKLVRDESPPLGTSEKLLTLYMLGAEQFAQLRQEVNDQRRRRAETARLARMQRKRVSRAKYMREWRKKQKRARRMQQESTPS